jgi:mono/diheme cytochrome c family protein
MLAGVNTIGAGMFTQATRAVLVTAMTSGTILAVVYFLAWKNSRDFGLGHAFAVLFLALAATGSTEHAREMIRKPYTVGQFMYSNGVRKPDVAKLNKAGFTAASPWGHGEMPVGEQMFRGQCMSCHTVDGYRSMRKFMHGRDRKAIAGVLAMLHENKKDSPYGLYMPPAVGTAAEMDALADYLDHMVNGTPTLTAKLAGEK